MAQDPRSAMAFGTSAPMALHAKADAEGSDSERSCISVNVMLDRHRDDKARIVSDGQHGRPGSWFCVRYRLAPLSLVVLCVLCLLGVEFATLRATHWRQFSKELKALEGKNAALLTNLTAMKSFEHRSQEQLLLMESEMRLRTMHCGDLKREMELLQEENAKLRKKVSRVVAEQAVASKELVVRRNQFEALSAEAMVLREENFRLQHNITRLEELEGWLQHDLDNSYDRFLNLSSALSKQRKVNGKLRANLSADDDDMDMLLHYTAREAAKADGLVKKNRVLRRNLSMAEITVNKEKQTEKLNDQELTRRYHQYVGMSEEVELLRARNAMLEGKLSEPRGLEEQKVEE